MKKINAVLLAMLCVAAVVQADTLVYDFESGMGVSGTTAAGTGDVTWNPMYAPVAGDSVRAYDSITPANDVFLINSRANENEANVATAPGTYSSYFEFSLTAAAGQQLDLSSALVSADFAAYQDAATTYTTWYRVYTETSDNPGVWTQQGSRRNLIMTAAAPGNAYNTGFTDSATASVVTGYSLTPAGTTELHFNRSMDLSGLGTLADGVDLNVRLMVADSRKNNANFYSSVDNIKLDNLTVIPEPATLGLVAVMGAGMLWARRRFSQSK